MPMSNIAIIGDRDSVTCFRAVGVEVFAGERAEEIQAHLSQVLKGDYAVVFITEQAAVHVESEIQEAAWKPLPSIVLIPNNRGSLGKGQREIREVVKRAVGADIMKDED